MNSIKSAHELQKKLASRWSGKMGPG